MRRALILIIDPGNHLELQCTMLLINPDHVFQIHKEAHMRKHLFISVTTVMILLFTITNTKAITFGQPDGNGHPQVGLLLGDFLGNGTPIPHCSGTLIAQSVFLTAGHCTKAFTDAGVTNVWVTFDPVFDPDASPLIPAVGFATHPNFNSNTLFNDVGVVLLSQPVQGVTFGTLPTLNLLDQMKADGTLQNQTFVNVGYGATAVFKGMPPLLNFDGVRRFSLSPFSSLTQNWLHLLGNNDATNEGGTCSGDSGGPHFLGDTLLIVSVTSWGDGVCRSLSMSQRLDTQSVRDFLSGYVDLP
jgi:Trypsin